MKNDNKCNFCRLLRSTERENIDKVIAELEKLGFFDAQRAGKITIPFLEVWSPIP